MPAPRRGRCRGPPNRPTCAPCPSRPYPGNTGPCTDRRPCQSRPRSSVRATATTGSPRDRTARSGDRDAPVGLRRGRRRSAEWWASGSVISRSSSDSRRQRLPSRNALVARPRLATPQPVDPRSRPCAGRECTVSARPQRRFAAWRYGFALAQLLWIRDRRVRSRIEPTWKPQRSSPASACSTSSTAAG